MPRIHVCLPAALLVLMVLVMHQHTKAQSAMTPIFALSDSTPTLTLDQFYKIILQNHPVVRQAELLDDVAQQELRLARGSFDPKVVSSFDHKEFQDKTYYSKLDAYLAFPTWFPVNPKLGYQRATGDLVNNEDVISGGEQLYAGVAIPIGKGLFTDERRTAVRQAQAFTSITTAEQVKIINKILLEAAKTYWQWYYAYYQYRLSSQSVAIASEIFSRIKLNMQQGEAAMIDTIQAKITLQSRLVERQEAWLGFQNMGITLSNYMWNEQAEALQLGTAVAPVMTNGDQTFLSTELLQDLVMKAKENHPELVKLSLKLDQLEWERKLAREFLKPQLDLNYSMLSQPTAPHRVDPLNDYKIGLDFSFPIFLRKERSKVALTKLKIDNTQYQQKQSEREIVNEINTTFNELQNTIVILKQQQEVVELYDRLLKSELLNLENGESDLFKINIQQEKLLLSQSKLLKLTADLQKQKALLYWSAGIRNLNSQPD
ncbi:TolC family protein [Chryseolinea lacunae]|uniref:TolC family protein n=1 Tax=Chryseolinea lacunae TaxID=2801331 RepID=A0ABS1KKS9_9BACT|nr:TolC family protein [Chryseolinea lacunae]MBL0739943.1 TolC family protein [Chryseolinea lacunae]